MPIVGDFSCQSSLIGFYQELFPDNRTYLKHEGGLSGYVPPATKPLRHGHYHSIVPQDVCSGFLSITRHLELKSLMLEIALYAVCKFWRSMARYWLLATFRK